SYFRDLATRNWDGLPDWFAEDGVADIRNHGVQRGRETIRAMLNKDLNGTVTTRDAYWLSEPTLEVHGDEAEGTWIWHRMKCDFATSFGYQRIWGPWSEGIYRVKYRRINGEWKIQDLWSRVYAPDTDDEIAEAGKRQAVIGAGYWKS